VIVDDSVRDPLHARGILRAAYQIAAAQHVVGIDPLAQRLQAGARVAAGGPRAKIRQRRNSRTTGFSQLWR